MTLNIQSEKIFSPPKGNIWTILQILTDEENTERGTLYVAMSIAATPAFQIDVMSYSRKILATIHEGYFGNTTLTNFNAIKAVAEKMEKSFPEMILSVSLLGEHEGVVYAAATRGGRVYIYRNKLLSAILASYEEVISASGHPQEGDFVILCTKAFSTEVTESDLRGVFAEEDQDQLTMDGLKKALAMKIERPDAAALVIGFDPQASLEKVTPTTEYAHSDEETIHPVSEINTKQKNPLKQISAAGLLGGLSALRRRKPISVKQEEEIDETVVKKRKLTMIAGLVMLVLLVASIAWGSYQKKQKDADELFRPRLSEAQRNYEEALSLLTLSPDRAREHYLKAVELVESLKSDEIENDELAALASDLAESKGRVLGEYTTPSESFIDLTLLSDGFSGDDMAAADDVLYILDKDKERVVSIAIDTKRSEVVAGPGAAADGLNIAVFADRVYVGKDNEVLQVDGSKEQVIDEDLGNDYILYAYSGNIYIVRRDQSTIKRYSAYEGGVTEGASWLREGAEPDLSRIVSMAIDGNIWMVSSTGGVFRFSVGNQLNFSISGLFPEIVSPTQIYTNDELEYLYILEPTLERIVVLTKEGDFVAQYSDEELANAKDFAVSEKEKKIIFLTGEKLHYFEIGHL